MQDDDNIIMNELYICISFYALYIFLKITYFAFFAFLSLLDDPICSWWALLAALFFTVAPFSIRWAVNTSSEVSTIFIKSSVSYGMATARIGANDFTCICVCKIWELLRWFNLLSLKFIFECKTIFDIIMFCLKNYI